MVTTLLNSTKKAKTLTTFLPNHKNNQGLKFKKIATGATFDVFQWKRPKNSNNHYKVILNGKEFSKITDADRVLETISISNFIEGNNLIKLIAYTEEEGENYTEQISFLHR